MVAGKPLFKNPRLQTHFILEEAFALILLDLTAFFAIIRAPKNPCSTVIA